MSTYGAEPAPSAEISACAMVRRQSSTRAKNTRGSRRAACLHMAHGVRQVERRLHALAIVKSDHNGRRRLRVVHDRLLVGPCVAAHERAVVDFRASPADAARRVRDVSDTRPVFEQSRMKDANSDA